MEPPKEPAAWFGFEENILDKGWNPVPMLEKAKHLASFAAGELELEESVDLTGKGV